MTHNLWYWFLNSIAGFLLNFFLPFLPQHVDWGIAQVISQYASPILTLIFVGVGTFIHLGTLARIIALLIMIEGVKALAAFRKIIARLIKFATFIGLLG